MCKMRFEKDAAAVRAETAYFTVNEVSGPTADASWARA